MYRTLAVDANQMTCSSDGDANAAAQASKMTRGL